MSELSITFFAPNRFVLHHSKVFQTIPPLDMSILQLNNMDVNQTRSHAITEQKKLRRKNFLLFVKILFRLLHLSGDEQLLQQAKRLVVRCRHNTSPALLDHVVWKELKHLVGDNTFIKAQKLVFMYLARQNELADNQARSIPVRTNPSTNGRCTGANFEQAAGTHPLQEVMTSIERFIHRRADAATFQDPEAV
jgi:hypothetical protein